MGTKRLEGVELLLPSNSCRLHLFEGVQLPPVVFHRRETAKAAARGGFRSLHPAAGAPEERVDLTRRSCCLILDFIVFEEQKALTLCRSSSDGKPHCRTILR